MNTSWTSAIQWQAPRQDWQDRSVLAFSVPVGHGAAVPPNVTLSRDERRAPQDPPGEAFEPLAPAADDQEWDCARLP